MIWLRFVKFEMLTATPLAILALQLAMNRQWPALDAAGW
jgi:hypothetical protein